MAKMCPHGKMLLRLVLYPSEKVLLNSTKTFNKELFAQLRSFPSGVVCAGSINILTSLTVSSLKLFARIKEKGVIMFSPLGILTLFCFSEIIPFTADTLLRSFRMLDIAKKLATGKNKTKLP